jgi:hypothetical protein
LARFYGFSHNELRLMSVKDMNDYVLAMEKLEAHETLKDIRATAYPYMAKEDRERVFRKLTASLEIETKELEASEIAKLLGFV